MRDLFTKKNNDSVKTGFLFYGIAFIAVMLIIAGITGCSVNKGTEANSTDLSEVKTEVEKKVETAMAVPESENGWVDYEKASLELKFDERFSPQILAEQGINDENINEVEQPLTENAQVLKLLNQGYEKTSFQIYIDYKKGAAAKVPNFRKLRSLAYFLTLAGDYEQSRGNDKQAAVHYLQCVRLGQGAGNNGSLIFGMIGIAIEKIGLKPLKALLCRENISAETCSYITEEMTKLNKDHFTMTQLLDGEMLFIDYSFESIMKGEFDNDFKEYRNKPQLIGKERAAYGEWYLEARKAVEGSYNDSLKKISAIKPAPENSLIDKFIPNIGKAYNHYIKIRTEFRGIMLLSAVREFREAKGSYPENLNMLIPEFIDEIPADPISADNKFIYNNESGKAILYSVGINQKDDGGKQAEDKDLADGDMVFLNNIK